MNSNSKQANKIKVDSVSDSFFGFDSVSYSKVAKDSLYPPVKPQSFPYENQCEYYIKLALRSWPVLFTLTYFFYTYTLLVCGKIKSCSNHCFFSAN